jgi:hypothetical protein
MNCSRHTKFPIHPTLQEIQDAREDLECTRSHIGNAFGGRHFLHSEHRWVLKARDALDDASSYLEVAENVFKEGEMENQ